MPEAAALYQIWDGIRAVLKDNITLNDSFWGALKVYNVAPDKETLDRNCTEILILHSGTTQPDATHDLHTFVIRAAYCALAQPNDYGEMDRHPLKRMCLVQEAIRQALRDNTIDNTVSGGCIVGKSSGILPGNTPHSYVADMTVQCLELLDPAINGPEITSQWRLYYGTMAYSTGAYTDVTGWKLLSRDVAFKHLPDLPGRSILQTSFKNVTKWPKDESYTAEERHVIARVTKSDNETWGMYLGQTIADGADMPLMHVSTGFANLPKKALLLVNKMSDGAFLAFYGPRANLVPMADVGTRAPYMTLRGNMLGDDDNLESDSTSIIGHGKIYPTLSFDWD